MLFEQEGTSCIPGELEPDSQLWAIDNPSPMISDACGAVDPAATASEIYDRQLGDGPALVEEPDHEAHIPAKVQLDHVWLVRHDSARLEPLPHSSSSPFVVSLHSGLPQAESG